MLRDRLLPTGPQQEADIVCWTENVYASTVQITDTQAGCLLWNDGPKKHPASKPYSQWVETEDIPSLRAHKVKTQNRIRKTENGSTPVVYELDTLYPIRL